MGISSRMLSRWLWSTHARKGTVSWHVSRHKEERLSDSLSKSNDNLISSGFFQSAGNLAAQFSISASVPSVCVICSARSANRELLCSRRPPRSFHTFGGQHLHRQPFHDGGQGNQTSNLGLGAEYWLSESPQQMKDESQQWRCRDGCVVPLRPSLESVIRHVFGPVLIGSSRSSFWVLV